MLRFLLFLSLSLPCIAEEATATGAPTSSSYAQAGLALALIVGLILGAAWLARKLWAGRGFGQSGMKVIGGVNLGPRERIVMLEAGDTWLIVGIVPGQIRTLHTLPKGSLPGNDTTPPVSFAQWLHSMRDKTQ